MTYAWIQVPLPDIVLLCLRLVRLRDLKMTSLAPMLHFRRVPNQQALKRMLIRQRQPAEMPGGLSSFRKIRAHVRAG